MHITDADRDAANALRIALADICGFWHSPGDDSPICQALARHRIEAERRTAEQLKPIIAPVANPLHARDFVPAAPPAAGERAAADALGAMTTVATLTSLDFRCPTILLSGTVDYQMYQSFRDQFEAAPESGLVSIELSTLGGDPEVARMMGEDIRFHSEINPDRRIVFLGKAAIYSAGTTFMSFFARENRYLTRGTRLMIHERKLSKTLQIEGPLTTCIASVEATLNEIQASIVIQNEGFENLIRGSQVTMDEVLQKAPSNWYIEANEAQALGLIEGVL